MTTTAKPVGSSWKLSLALACLLVVSLVNLGNLSLTVSLDTSWAMGLAYFLQKGFRAGTDYVFTFGPLGFFYSLVFIPKLFWAKFGWEILTRLLFAASVLSLLKDRDRFEKWITCGLLSFFLAWMADSFYTCLGVSMALLLLSVEKPSLFSILLVPSCLAVLSLVKFTMLTSSVIALLVIFTHLFFFNRKLSPVPLITYAAVFCLGWGLLGQSLSDLPCFVQGGVRISSGYTEAMSINGRPEELAFALLGLLLFALLVGEIFRSSAQKKRDLPALLLFSVAIFTEWKHGFIRHDGAHASIFFSSAAALACLLRLSFQTHFCRSSLLRGAYWLLIGSSGMGLCTILTPQTAAKHYLANTFQNAQAILMPWRMEQRLLEESERLKTDPFLNAAKQAVGDHSIDVLANAQMFLILYEFNWRPRPIFQSYTAYGPELAGMNAAYFNSDSAPDYLLFGLGPIDNRPPALEEGTSLPSILMRYSPVLGGEDLLLLKRSQSPGPNFPPPGAETLRAVMTPERMVPLDPKPDRAQFIKLYFHQSPWGKLRNFFFKLPYIIVYLETSEGRKAFRLPPNMAREGFLINPFLETSETTQRLYQGTQPKPVTGLAIRIDETGPRSFESEIEMERTDFQLTLPIVRSSTK